MTIFRCELALAAVLLAGCANNMPSEETELGRVLHNSDSRLLENDIRKWALMRINDPNNLRQQLLAAGFESVQGEAHCEAYLWTGNMTLHFPMRAYLKRCGNSLEVGANVVGAI